MRCSKCLIPSSLVGSNFDQNNECIWCQSNYPDYFPLGEAKLQQVIEQYKVANAAADCLVGIRPLSLGAIKHFSLCFHGCLGASPMGRYMSVRFPSLKHIFFFDYYDWNPPAILEKLTSEVGWKRPEKLASDWHSDCAFTIFED